MEQIESYITGFKLSIIIFIILIIIGYLYVKIITLKTNYLFGIKIKKPKSIYYVENFREIPYYDIVRTYFIAINYGLTKKDYNIIGAYILKWYSEGIVEFKNNKYFKINEYAKIDDLYEKELYDYFLKISNYGVIYKKKLKKWIKENDTIIYFLLSKMVSSEINKLISENKITEVKGKYILDDSLEEEAIKLKGLKQYLEEFSSVDIKEETDVKFFDYYLIYAQIFGIADKVAEKIDKEILIDIDFSYDSFTIIRPYLILLEKIADLLSNANANRRDDDFL